jgi:hypothetical protein
MKSYLVKAEATSYIQHIAEEGIESLRHEYESKTATVHPKISQILYDWKETGNTPSNSFRN